MRKSRRLNSKRKLRISKKGGYKRQRQRFNKKTHKRRLRNTRRMKGGNIIARVGKPWDPSNIDSWGSTNYYSLKDYFGRMDLKPAR